MYKSAEQEADRDEELDPAESFAHTNSVLKVCQECNFPGGIINSRLMQEFKTKIWRMNQVLAKAKKMGGNGVKKKVFPTGLPANFQPGVSRFIIMKWTV